MIPGSTPTVSSDKAATPLAYRLPSDSVAMSVTPDNLCPGRHVRIRRHPRDDPEKALVEQRADQRLLQVRQVRVHGQLSDARGGRVAADRLVELGLDVGLVLDP